MVFEVDDIDAEYARVTRDGIEVTTPIELVQWVGAPPEEVVVDDAPGPGAAA